MSSQVAANQSYSGKRTSANLAKAKTWVRRLMGSVATIFAAASSAIVVTRAAGSAVVAGGALVPLTTLNVLASGKFQVWVAFSGTAPAGNVTPIAGAAAHGASIPVLASGPVNTTTFPTWAAMFQFNSGLAIGQQVDFSFTTTAGDQTVTIGHAAGSGAQMLIQELPI